MIKSADWSLPLTGNFFKTTPHLVKSAIQLPSNQDQVQLSQDYKKKNTAAMEYDQWHHESSSSLSAGQKQSPTTSRWRLNLSWHRFLVPAFSHAWPPHRSHPWSAPGRLSKMCSHLIWKQVVKRNIWKNENKKKFTEKTKYIPWLSKITSLSYWMTQFWRRITCWTNGLRFDTRILIQGSSW